MTFDITKVPEITNDAAIQERAILRAKYFEQEGYRKLSDVLPEFPFVQNRDNYMLARYITGNESTGDLYTEQIERHKDKKDINWDAIYDYLDERRTYDNWISGDQERCDRILKQFEAELRNQGAFCLY